MKPIREGSNAKIRLQAVRAGNHLRVFAWHGARRYPGYHSLIASLVRIFAVRTMGSNSREDRMETNLTRNELKTLFYVGRKLELVNSLMGPCAPQARTVKAQRSYGYDLEKADGRI